jgi:hypothetical protein
MWKANGYNGFESHLPLSGIRGHRASSSNAFLEGTCVPTRGPMSQAQGLMLSLRLERGWLSEIGPPSPLCWPWLLWPPPFGGRPLSGDIDIYRYNLYYLNILIYLNLLWVIRLVLKQKRYHFQGFPQKSCGSGRDEVGPIHNTSAYYWRRGGTVFFTTQLVCNRAWVIYCKPCSFIYKT